MTTSEPEPNFLVSVREKFNFFNEYTSSLMYFSFHSRGSSYPLMGRHEKTWHKSIRILMVKDD